MDFNEIGRYWCCHEDTVLAYRNESETGFVPIISQMVWELTGWVRDGRYFFGKAQLYINGACHVYEIHGVIDPMSDNVSVQLVMPDGEFRNISDNKPVNTPPQNLRFDGRIFAPPCGSLAGKSYPIFHMKTCESTFMQNVKMIPRSVLVEDTIPVIGLVFSAIVGPNDIFDKK
jgi:hypothetical protein